MILKGLRKEWESELNGEEECCFCVSDIQRAEKSEPGNNVKRKNAAFASLKEQS